MKKGIAVLVLCFFSAVVFCQNEKSACSFKLGLENISESFLNRLRTQPVGIITNQTGRDQKGQRNIDLLLQQGVNIKMIFVPEHGLDGKTLAGIKVNNIVDDKTGISVVSLYGDGSGKKISADTIKTVDIILFDMQDSGMRHYTYISTLFCALEAAALNDKQFVVLDRPNPLGAQMEGPLVEQGLQSFISIAPIPVRHGMTMGELAWYLNKHLLAQPAKLHVVRMRNYNRYHGLNGSTLVALSPNLQTLQSCYGYSFLGLLGEVSPCDVAVGTDRAFQSILLSEDLLFSKKQWNMLRTILKGHAVETSFYRYFNKQKKRYYQGLKIYISDINAVSSFAVLLNTLDFFKNEGIELNFSQSFDKAVGTSKVKSVVISNISRKKLADVVNRELRSFFKKAQSSFMYHPWPNLLSID